MTTNTAVEEPAVQQETVPFAAYCTPLYDKLIVQVDPEKEMEGSVHIPDAHREAPCVGTVLAAGEGRLLESGMICPMRPTVGSRVMFGKYAGVKIPEDAGYGARIIVLREDELLWVFPAVKVADAAA